MAETRQCPYCKNGQQEKVTTQYYDPATKKIKQYEYWICRKCGSQSNV